MDNMIQSMYLAFMKYKLRFKNIENVAHYKNRYVTEWKKAAKGIKQKEDKFLAKYINKEYLGHI